MYPWGYKLAVNQSAVFQIGINIDFVDFHDTKTLDASVMGFHYFVSMIKGIHGIQQDEADSGRLHLN